MTGPASSPPMPPAYRRAALRGVAAFALTALALGGWLFSRADITRAEFQARVPHASAPVKTIYATPHISAEAAAAFDAPAAPEAKPAADAPKPGILVGVLMTGLGLSDMDTERAIEDLPPGVALAFSPYGDLARWLTAAKDQSRERLVLLPMEPRSYPKDDPGPRALLSRVTKEENAKILSSLLRDSVGASGLVNFMGSEFLADKENLAPVFGLIKKSGALFVEDRGPAPTPSEAAAVAAEAGVPFLQSDVALDAVPTESAVSQKLVELEALARARGYAIGVAAPYPVTFNMIKSWAAGLESRGARLAPLSDILKAAAAAPPQPAPSPTPSPEAKTP